MGFFLEMSKDFKKLLELALSSKNQLIDDELLNEKDKKKVEGCGSTIDRKRKPCANCNCSNSKTIETPKKKSACGSCYLGDAFRCAGCPYLGMPSFEVGEDVLLDSDE